MSSEQHAREPIPAIRPPNLESVKKRIADKQEHVRETWVRAMETRLVKDELNKCYRGEGVNQKENCKELAERYLTMLKTNKLEGYVQVVS